MHAKKNAKTETHRDTVAFPEYEGDADDNKLDASCRGPTVCAWTRHSICLHIFLYGPRSSGRQATRGRSDRRTVYARSSVVKCAFQNRFQAAQRSSCRPVEAPGPAKPRQSASRRETAFRPSSRAALHLSISNLNKLFPVSELANAHQGSVESVSYKFRVKPGDRNLKHHPRATQSVHLHVLHIVFFADAWHFCCKQAVRAATKGSSTVDNCKMRSFSRGAGACGTCTH